MTAVRSITLICDCDCETTSDGYGECRYLGRIQFETWTRTTAMWRVQRAARAAGWRRREQRDICDRCQEHP